MTEVDFDPPPPYPHEESPPPFSSVAPEEVPVSSFPETFNPIEENCPQNAIPCAPILENANFQTEDSQNLQDLLLTSSQHSAFHGSTDWKERLEKFFPTKDGQDAKCRNVCYGCWVFVMEITVNFIPVFHVLDNRNDLTISLCWVNLACSIGSTIVWGFGGWKSKTPMVDRAVLPTLMVLSIMTFYLECLLGILSGNILKSFFTMSLLQLLYRTCFLFITFRRSSYLVPLREFELCLEDTIFYPRDVIIGTIRIRSVRQMTIKSLNLQFLTKAQTFCSEDAVFPHFEKHYQSFKIFYHFEKRFLGGYSSTTIESTQTLQPPFRIPIPVPDKIPSTLNKSALNMDNMDIQYGDISHRLEVTLKIETIFGERTLTITKIITICHLMRISNVQRESLLSSWTLTGTVPTSTFPGRIKLKATAPLGAAYSPGDTITLSITVENESHKTISCTTAQLMESTKYTFFGDNSPIKKGFRILSKSRLSTSVPPGNVAFGDVLVGIPTNTEAWSFDAYAFISRQYYVEVTAQSDPGNNLITLCCPVLIGEIL